MFTIIKEYTPDSRGRWIYRGMLVGGSIVGRWRDTHTCVSFFFPFLPLFLSSVLMLSLASRSPVDLSGYEGTFTMSRR
jgi:hypothetical protein